MSTGESDELRGEGIALIGYRATGKTTLGRILAEQLCRPFVDSDLEIEARTHRSIAECFAVLGEPAFRLEERSAIRDLCKESPRAILATGGGAILSETTRGTLRRFGRIIWLSAPAPVLVKRLKREGGGRPALTSAGLLDEVASVLASREPLYRACADLIVDVSTDHPGALAIEITRRLGLEGNR